MIRAFAARERLRIVKECGEEIIPGRNGHLYEHNAETLGLCFLGATKYEWIAARKKLVGVNGRLKLDCESEGLVLLDPLDSKQVKMALDVLKLTPRTSPHLVEVYKEERRKEWKTIKRSTKQSN